MSPPEREKSGERKKKIGRKKKVGKTEREKSGERKVGNEKNGAEKLLRPLFCFLAPNFLNKFWRLLFLAPTFHVAHLWMYMCRSAYKSPVFPSGVLIK